MTLPATIAHYQLTSKLGEGGMGAVYRATDTKLHREVAIKILPDAFAQDPDRMARFTREAQTLAALNHPNIAQIYGIEDRAIVMELVEGADLHGPVPLDTALDYARQIAIALEAAHEKGITHRDLKPANIKVTPQGVVKLLDFGLARAADSGASAGVTQNSPTLSMGATQTGVILGTAAYMSPEQAKGKPVDRRADIWAFGAVLVEMLTGKPLWEGDNVSEILAAVILNEPDLARVPASIRPVVERCLRKDPLRRWQWIGDVRLALEEPAPTATAAPAAAKTRTWPWIAALALAILAAPAAWLIKPAPEPPLQQFEINAPPGVTIGLPTYGQLAVAPDGRSVVFVGHGADGIGKLWLRRFDAATATMLDGTENARFPAWSTDGRSISFASAGKLKILDLGGGAPRQLGEARGTTTWNTDGVIISPVGSEMEKYQASGGPATPVLNKVPGEDRQSTPWFFPDGKRFLYSSVGAQNGERVGHLDGTVGPVLEGVGSPATLALDPSGTAWLFYGVYPEVLAQRFDLAREAPVGTPVTLVTGVPAGPSWSTSLNGVLALRHTQKESHQLTWSTRQGQRTETVGDAAVASHVRISPDQRSALFSRQYGNDTSVWLLGITSKAATRFTLGANDQTPIWSADGTHVYYSSARDGRTFALVERPTDGSGAERVLVSGLRIFYPSSITPDGKFIIASSSAADSMHAFAIPAAGSSPARLPGDAMFNPEVSPDGRWLLYAANRPGLAPDVFVEPLPAEAGGAPGRTGNWQISRGGGSQAVWRADGKEIFFVDAEGRMMAAPVESSGESFRAGVPVALFQTHFGSSAAARPRGYDVTADGQRFLVRDDVAVGPEPPISVVLNWRKLIR